MRDVAHLAELQAERDGREQARRHRTRHRPKRADEICGGGSIYWVIAGVLLARQRVNGIIEDAWEDGSRCAGLLLDPALVRVSPRPMKPFQGWRYLRPEDAPPDLSTGSAGADELPPELRLALVRLALL